MIKLQGEYQFSNSSTLKALSGNITLLIGKRHKPSTGKPPSFILLVNPEGGREYISSLFPAPKWSVNGLEAYSLDWQGKTYHLQLNRPEGRAVITSHQESPKGGGVGQIS